MARAAGGMQRTGGNVALSPEELAAFRAAIIADLAADVEPVYGAVANGEVVYSASTVATLKSERDALRARVAELEGVIDSVLLDIDDDGVAEARDIAVIAMRNIRNGRPQYEGLDDLTKGQQ